MLGAISATSGKFTYVTSPSFFRHQDMIDFLKMLREGYGNRKLALFLDNATIHKTKRVKEVAEELQIQLIFNVPYSPHLNGVEHVWGKMKVIFRKRLTHLKITRDTVNLSEVVTDIVSDITPAFCKACAWRGLKSLGVPAE